MLWEAGDRGGKVFFPQSGVVSICVPTRDGECIEVASIGREGAAGLNDGLLPAVTQAVIQAPGRFIGISAHPFAAAVHQSAELARMAALCNGWLLLQAQQIAACNAVHPADARFCRWLLRACDALGVEMISVRIDRPCAGHPAHHRDADCATVPGTGGHQLSARQDRHPRPRRPARRRMRLLPRAWSRPLAFGTARDRRSLLSELSSRSGLTGESREPLSDVPMLPGSNCRRAASFGETGSISCAAWP